MNHFTLRDFAITVGSLVIITVAIAVTQHRTLPFTLLAVSQAPPVSVPSTHVTTTLSDVHAPDGTRKLTMKRVTLTATESAYVVTTSDISGANRTVLYQTVLPVSDDLILPPNSWSPDNKFVFVKITSPQGLSVQVFQSNGEAFGDGQPAVDVSQIFHEKLPDVALRDVTGWDDPSLLHVMTYAADKSIGFSYWFDMWGRNFIELAHR